MSSLAIEQPVVERFTHRFESAAQKWCISQARPHPTELQFKHRYAAPPLNSRMGPIKILKPKRAIMHIRINPQDRIHIPLFVLFLFITSMAFAQEKQEKSLTSRNINKAVSDSLAPGSTHVYTLALKADQFVYGEVDQITVDAVVTIKDPAVKITH